MKHSVDRAALLLACAQAVRVIEEQEQVDMIKLHVEKTARRIYDYIAFYWSGQEMPSIDSLFSPDKSNADWSQNGDIAIVDGEEFTILR